MSIASQLALLANTKEQLRLKLGLDVSVPFSQYVHYINWTPVVFFNNGQVGVWYDPSDLSTLFQDAAGTISVTSSGDPVGLMLDKSGNGNHAVAPSSAARPTYQTDGILHWLAFDGVDDVLVCMYPAVINQPNSVSIAFQFLGGVRVLGDTSSTVNRQMIYASSSGDRWFAGSSASDIGFSGANAKLVLSGEFNDINSFYVKNGSASAIFNAGANATSGIAIGADYNGAYAGKINLYGLVTVDRSIDHQKIEKYLAARAGVTL